MKNKLITVPEELLSDILPLIKGSKFEKQVKEILGNSERYQTQNISYFPKKAKVKRVVDGDTVVLENGSVVRYVGVTTPENNEPFEKQSSGENKKLADKFGRILAYLIVGGKNISVEIARLGMAQVVVYQKKKPFIHIDQLLKAQAEAKKNKRGIWSK